MKQLEITFSRRGNIYRFLFFIKIISVGGEKMFVLNVLSQNNIFKATGMTVEQIINTDFEDIDNHIAKRVGHRITEYILDERLASQEQVYSEAERFITMDEVDKELGKHDRRKSRFIRKIFKISSINLYFSSFSVIIILDRCI